jgi:hypothetical protein
MRKILFLTGLLLSFAKASQANDILKVVATVDDKAITSRYIRDKIALYEIFLSGQKMTYESLYKLALQNSIDDYIIKNYYKNYTIPDFAITELINKLLLDNRMTESDLEAFLARKNLTIENLKDYFYNQMVWSNFLLEDLYSNQPKRHLFEKDFGQSQIIQAKIAANDEAASQFLIEREFNKNSKVLLSEILIKSNDQKILNRIMAGEDFIKIQKDFPEKVELQGEGGNLGWLTFSDLAQAYQEAIRATGVGQVSQPIVGPNFMLFLKVVALEGVIEKKYQKNPNYLNLPKKQKITFELQKTLGDYYSPYKLKSLRAKHYIKILENSVT